MTPDLSAFRNKAFVIGGVGIALSLVGLAMNPDQFLRSYLIGFLYWVGLPLGCMALLMLHHLVGGGWGIVIRRMLESGTRTFLLIPVLALPILVSLPRLYVWAQPGAMAHDPLLQHKASYLNVPGFIGRAAFYFAIWLLLAHLLNKYSREQERDQSNGWKRKLQNLSALGILLYGLTGTFASVDWVMSLDPEWYSTIYGMMFLVSSALATMSFVIIVLARYWKMEPMAGLVRTSHFHDLGSLMFAFLMLWAYISFSQFLIIWSGNLPEEITWYVVRFSGTWGAVALLLVVFHFVAPFFLLLMRKNKRRVEILSKIAMAMLAMHLLDLIWVVAPSFHVEQLQIHWLDLTATIGIGGLWIGFFAWQLSKRPLIPVESQLLAEAPHEGGGH